MGGEVTARRREKSAAPVLPDSTPQVDTPPSPEASTPGEREQNYLRQAERSRAGGTAALTLGCILCLFAILRGPVIFWAENGRGIIPSGTRTAMLGLALIALGAGARYFRRGVTRGAPHSAKVPSLPVPSEFIVGAAAAGPLLVYLSDWMVYPYNFFQAPSIRGELFLAFLLGGILLRSRVVQWLRWAPLAAALLLGVSFFQESRGEVLFSDDHASVMYRLTLLKEMFPHIPYYNPFWNAGTNARETFSTGLLNVYFLFYPLIQFFPVERVYNIIVASVLFGLVPGMTYLAARREGFSPLARGIAATLAVTSGLTVYQWGLKYGPMGFMTSYALAPLAVVLTGVAIDREDTFTPLDALLTATLIVLLLCWSPAGFVLLPVIAAGLPRIRTILRKPYAKPVLGAVLLCTLPWVVLWLNTVDVFKFVAHKQPSFSQQADGAENPAQTSYADSEHPADQERSGLVESSHRRVKSKPRPMTPRDLAKQIRNIAMNAHPLLLFFGPIGIFFFPRRSSRTVHGIVLTWLFFMGLVLAPLKPQLELERMLAIALLLLSLPAGQALALLFESAQGKSPRRVPFQMLAAVSFAYFLTGMPTAAAVIRNRTLINYTFTDETVHDFVRAIDQYGGEGRVVFTGFILHELNRGHLAPLAYYTGRPLVASSPVHDTWWYTDIIPNAFRKRDEAGIEEYFDIMNATAVVAHERWWREYFQSHPERYTEVWGPGRFVMFRRSMAVPSYFYEGSGELLTQAPNEIRLRTDTPNVVLKFSYYSFLESSSCRIAPRQLYQSIRLIELSDCAPGSEVLIRGKTGFERLRSVR